MIANIARLLGIDAARVNLKGKTHEKVDAVGEGRAVEVHVVCLLARVR
jgi:2C-methyl-D-erythritol 2,4-cyclodiphosphate synthase